MDYSFLKKTNTTTIAPKLDYSFLLPKKSVKKETIPTKTKINTLPDFLGGGSYNSAIGQPNTLVKTPRDYAGVSEAIDKERHHIIPVEFGGDSTMDKNIVSLGEKAHARITKGEAKISSDYKSGKIDLPEARVKIMGLLQKEQDEAKGITQSIAGNILNSFKNSFVKPFTAEGRKEAMGKSFQEQAGTLDTASKIASEVTGKEINPKNYNESFKALSQEDKNLISAKLQEKQTERGASIATAPVRFTAGSLASLATSYALEKADANLKYTPKTDAEKLIIGETEIQRLTKQEDLYGIVARVAGIPTALILGAVLENPFIKEIGVGTLVKETIEKQIAKGESKLLAKLGGEEIIKMIDDGIKIGVKEGKIAEKEALKATESIKGLRVVEENPIVKESLKTEEVPIRKLKSIEGDRELAQQEFKTGKKSMTDLPVLVRKEVDGSLTVLDGNGRIVQAENAGKKTIKITTDETLYRKLTETKEPVYKPTIAPSAVPNRIQNSAISKGLKDTFGNTFEHDIITFEDQALKVGEIIDQDPEKAIRIALGQELPDNGALPESVLMAVVKQAEKNGDAELLIKLAEAEHGVAQEASILGARIKMYDQQLEDEAFRNINKVVEGRKSLFESKKGSLAKAKTSEVESIKKEIAKVKATKDEWLDFVNSIEC